MRMIANTAMKENRMGGDPAIYRIMREIIEMDEFICCRAGSISITALLVGGNNFFYYRMPGDILPAEAYEAYL